MSKQLSEHMPTFSYEVVIGIEVHVQLTTKTKIFCACENNPESAVNRNICPLCTGQPGILPLLNKEVVSCAIKAGLATHCTIAPLSFFDRKHYFYPDLPKGYQITQQYFPICTDGYIPIRTQEEGIKKIRIKRIHIEEDAGKNTHVKGSGETLVDLNRAGTPLLEVVSEPDMRSAHEARAYLKTLRGIVQSLQICSGNMQLGAFRADTNISVRKKGETTLGTKCELKNINSFKFIADAIEYETQRQIALLEAGKSVLQETRFWDSKQKVTGPMRTKEEAADYRYFRDPDLPGITLTHETITAIQQNMPELPFARYERYVTTLGLSSYEADIIVEDMERIQYFEQAYTARPSKLIVNWFLRDVLGYTNEHSISLEQCLVTPEKLVTIVRLIEEGTINSASAKIVFDAVAQTGADPLTVVQTHQLEQIDSIEELTRMAQRIIDAHPDTVAQYKSGKEKLFGFFVGQLMKETAGKGNPQSINEILKKLLR